MEHGSHSTIAALLEAQAEQRPNSIAVQAPQQEPLTYSQLAATCAEIAGALAAHGLTGSDRVAVVLPNGPQMAVSFLAVAGAMACAPLNPAYRRDDFDFFLRDLAVRALVVADPEHAAAEAARGLDLPVLCLHRRSNVAGDCCIEPPAGSGVTGEMPKPAAGDVALLLHTSGTTARPKIVPLSQTNLCTSAANIGRTLNLQPADVCLNIMPLFHIHGLVAALLATVSSGASIVCSPGFNGAEFAAWLRDFGVTWYSAVPTMHQAILDVVRRQPLFEHKLRFVRSSSASLPPAVMHELAQRFAVPVIEAYGMTEAAHQMASNPLPPGAQKPGSVGLPAGPEVSVMNEQGELLTVPGSVGEIVIRGATVTAGYENNPQANAGAFVNGWFRTGDQGYRDSDGYIYLTGRIKELINRGGEKIAPREIEEVLLQHDAVAQAVAFALPHERLGEEVGAAVVLRSGQSIDAAELRRFAADRLPYFKVPRVLQVVDKIPLGPTGKLQRNALAQSLGITAGAAARSGGGSDPRSDLERRLAADWAELLELPRVGIDEDFFALGGDSLAATELILRYSEEWGADIPIADFVEQPTIGGLVALYERCRSSALPGRRAGLVTIAAGTAGPPIFCPAPHDDSLWRTSILVRQLAMQRPVYGFLAPRLGRRATPLTMEQLASRNIELMQAVQERGPYHLLGACFGGIVAYEMARQLERAGQQVALLAMIDSYNWKWRLSLPQQKIAAGPPAAPPSSGNGSAPHRAERWERFVERWSFVAQQRAFNALVRVSLPRPQRLQDARYGNSWALKRYVPGTYDGNVFLVRATVPAPRIDPVPQLGWSALMRGEVEMIDIDCDRDALWSHAQFLQEVPAALRRRLQVG